jgi:hypothetical protein
MPVSILVGNGFNLIDNSQKSWEEILNEIAEKVGAPEIVSLYAHKPETLIFEQLAYADGRSNRETQIKEEIAKAMLGLRHNRLHNLALNLKFGHILTTNYDYSFEAANGTGPYIPKKNGSLETRYSLFRKHVVNETSIWHIHGEARSANTIMLGYEHYGGSLQNVRHYMTGNRKSENKKRVSKFKLEIDDFETHPDGHSWLDVFFRDDIHIIGLSLDYTEVVLWWAITYKKKLRYSSRHLSLGETYYYYTMKREPEPRQRLEAKLSILHSLGVKTKMLDSRNDHAACYTQILKSLGKLDRRHSQNIATAPTRTTGTNTPM